MLVLTRLVDKEVNNRILTKFGDHQCQEVVDKDHNKKEVMMICHPLWNKYTEPLTLRSSLPSLPRLLQDRLSHKDLQWTTSTIRLIVGVWVELMREDLQVADKTRVVIIIVVACQESTYRDKVGWELMLKRKIEDPLQQEVSDSIPGLMNQEWHLRVHLLRDNRIIKHSQMMGTHFKVLRLWVVNLTIPVQDPQQLELE